MDSTLRRTWAEIDMDALAHNNLPPLSKHILIFYHFIDD